MMSPSCGMLAFGRPFIDTPTLSPGPAFSCSRWCISIENTLPTHGLDAVWVGRKTTSSPLTSVPCSRRDVTTHSIPLIEVITLPTGARSAPSRLRGGRLTMSFRASSRHVTLTSFLVVGSKTVTPFHHGIFSDFFSRFSPWKPASGRIGISFSICSFFQPSCSRMRLTSVEISMKRFSLYVSLSTDESILLMPTMSCLMPSRFSRRAWLRVWPGTSPVLWSPLAIDAMNEPPSAGHRSRATSACDEPVIMFLMKSRWPGASMMV
mmetsp:Transcript_408/g.1555  ORF Transcript_408/g.1555 Transcript_408/m.1555 type:complete len:264 (-) Transcript_408:314-1105(-)